MQGGGGGGGGGGVVSQDDKIGLSLRAISDAWSRRPDVQLLGCSRSPAVSPAVQGRIDRAGLGGIALRMQIARR